MNREERSHTRVLIVEDDEAMSVALRDGFGFEGYEVLYAGDGISALEMVEKKSPHIVILDVGQADASVVIGSDGEACVIDAGRFPAPTSSHGRLETTWTGGSSRPWTRTTSGTTLEGPGVRLPR